MNVLFLLLLIGFEIEHLLTVICDLIKNGELKKRYHLKGEFRKSHFWKSEESHDPKIGELLFSLITDDFEMEYMLSNINQLKNS